MPRSPRFRAFFVAMIAALAVHPSSPAFADSGTIRLTIFKGGWIMGGSGGSGTLASTENATQLGVGGIGQASPSAARRRRSPGRVTHIRRASDVEGVYGAASAGGAIVRGAGTIVLRNEKGAVLELSGRQNGTDGQCGFFRTGDYAEVTFRITGDGVARPFR